MRYMPRSRHILVFSLLAALATACAEDQELIQVDDEDYASTSAASDESRVIIKYRNARGREAALAGGRLAVDLPEQAAVAMYLSEAALQGLNKNPNIEYIEPDAVRYPMAETTPYGVTMVQTNLVPASSASGRIQVCIIDSGIQGNHADFAGQAITGANTSGTGAWNTDLCGHGTHVAGTIAAVTGNGIGVASVAHSAASLRIVKVFGDDCSWTYSSGLVSALNICRQNGAKIVSMSLGGGVKSRTEETAFADADAAGVLSIAAAGNGGNTKLSYPAGYASVVSVAAIDSSKALASFSQRNADVELAAPGVAVESTYPYANSVTASGTTYNGGGIEFAASGNVNGTLVDGGLCDSTGAWSGKVVLCQRGVISFNDKVQNVQSSGGAAAVIYNNVSGGFAGTLGAGNSSTIPAISLSMEDGQALVASSLGLTSNVLSGLGSGYALLDGTSMATPHVSAVAALIWAQAPTKTNAQVRTALTATAQDLGAAGRDSSFGYGLVQAKAALDYLLSH